MFSALSRTPFKSKANPASRTEKRAIKSARLRRAMGLPNVLPVDRWDLF